MKYAVGSLVKAREREWVVLPDSTEDLLVLRPLGGTEDEVTGIYLPLETVESATFELPDPTQIGDYRSCRLLRDAIRLGFRSSAGPFRSFAQIAVEPRPYQLVPLLMALKLNPVRLLIADDVGIGKTIEACLVARELIDRGEAGRLAVLCPPALAEQWQGELKDKFHIDAELVLPSTTTRLERNCALGQSLFEVYPYVVVSMDFIKSDTRRTEFFRSCPELVIVDEAHTCAYSAAARSGRHQRHQLITGLSKDPERHLILVTATPHSGKEDAFRSLLTFIKPEFADLPEDLTGRQNEEHRRNLAQYFIQRQRGDIKRYLQEDTPFPDRLEKEATYNLSSEYKDLFNRVLDYARETVIDPQNNQHRQRVRWWSALALLRSLSSSPAAAASTLRTRAATIDTETSEEADEIGKRIILDQEDDEATERFDIAPGSDIGPHATDEKTNQRRLREMARQAEALQGEKDQKLMTAVPLIKELLKDGHRPIIFCRFIPTAEYLANELRSKLPKDVKIDHVTGLLPPAEREARVIKLADSPKRVLVCTDCLSEGINLQEHFDSVFHYDLSWNPTRHEQRNGRVDRYLQPKDTVRVLTYYGIDNQIDGIVLDVLVKKHKAIRSSLGISVPVPANTNQVIEAIFEGLLLRERTGSIDQYLPGFEEFLKPQKDELHNDWDNVAEREKRSRTMFAQELIKVEEVARELNAVREAIGSEADIETFVKEALSSGKAVVSGRDPVRFDLKESPRALREAIGNKDSFKARFKFPVSDGVLCLNRTHPVVEGLANYVMDTALDPLADGFAHRAGVIHTESVEHRTTLLLVRFRYHIITARDGREKPLLAEDCNLIGFAGSSQNPEWLDDKECSNLLDASPAGNISPDLASDFIRKVMDDFDTVRSRLNNVAEERGQALLDAHKRVRQAVGLRGVSYRVEPQLPSDVLGIYVYLPKV